MFANFIYIAFLTFLAPWLLWRCLRTGRYRHDLRAKLTGRVPFGRSKQFTVWFHGVSVGEIHLLATLIEAYRRRHPQHHIIVTSTTDTGLAEARKRFANVMAWPFDFTWAVSHAIDSVRPDLIVLAEGEMWPNFLRAAESRYIPVAVVNARLSPRSFKRYSHVAGLACRHLFNRTSRLAVQDEQYAERFRQLGVQSRKLTITGSIKYDGALKDRTTTELSHLLSVEGRTILVAGSTHAPEESIVLGTVMKLRTRFPDLRLILVPRHPDRFEEVAHLLGASGIDYVRRSKLDAPLRELPSVLLLDTIGELSAAWALADVGFVGGTLCSNRGGQSMIEPAGYGVPTVFGPNIWNFTDPAKKLIAENAALMVPDATALMDALALLLQDKELRIRMGASGRQVVAEQQGATQRTLDVLEELSNTFHYLRAA